MNKQQYYAGAIRHRRGPPDSPFVDGKTTTVSEYSENVNEGNRVVGAHGCEPNKHKGESRHQQTEEVGNGPHGVWVSHNAEEGAPRGVYDRGARARCSDSTDIGSIRMPIPTIESGAVRARGKSACNSKDAPAHHFLVDFRVNLIFRICTGDWTSGTLTPTEIEVPHHCTSNCCRNSRHRRHATRDTRIQRRSLTFMVPGSPLFTDAVEPPLQHENADLHLLHSHQRHRQRYLEIQIGTKHH
ncbi:hypothetical protein Pelo_11149 [Pelomyxa schiedti]|nr:hypothetical protein Pelo_11149 [Pelomyxa schiedti]